MNRTLRLHTLPSLLLLAAFLLFGYCPLRNTLVKLVNASPAKTGRSIPEYGKIAVATHCHTVTEWKALPLRGQLLHRPLLSFAAFLPGLSFAATVRWPGIIGADALLPGNWQSFIPIYLQNCVLRI